MNGSLIYRLRQVPANLPGMAWRDSIQIALFVEVALQFARFLGVVPLPSAHGLVLLMELATSRMKS